MLSTDDGIVRCVKDVHPSKADEPIYSTEEGILKDTCINDEQC